MTIRTILSSDSRENKWGTQLMEFFTLAKKHITSSGWSWAPLPLRLPRGSRTFSSDGIPVAFAASGCPNPEAGEFQARSSERCSSNWIPKKMWGQYLRLKKIPHNLVLYRQKWALVLDFETSKFQKGNDVMIPNLSKSNFHISWGFHAGRSIIRNKPWQTTQIGPNQKDLDLRVLCEVSYHLQKHVVTKSTPAPQVSEDAFETQTGWTKTLQTSQRVSSTLILHWQSYKYIVHCQDQSSLPNLPTIFIDQQALRMVWLQVLEGTIFLVDMILDRKTIHQSEFWFSVVGFFWTPHNGGEKMVMHRIR